MRRPLHALATLSFTLLAHCGSDPVPAPATDVPATRDTSAADAPDVVVVDAADASTDAPAGLARWPKTSATSEGTSSAIEKVATASIQK